MFVVGRIRRQLAVMRLDGRRYFFLHHCQIIQLIDHGDINSGRTGRAMAAIGTLSAVSMMRSEMCIRDRLAAVLSFRIRCFALPVLFYAGLNCCQDCI